MNVVTQQRSRGSDVWPLSPEHLACSFLLCPVVLNAPDTVLIERNLGKRIDPDTGGMMAPPSPQGIQEQ